LTARRRSALLGHQAREISNEEADGVAPGIVGVAAKFECAVEDRSARGDVDDVEAQAADQSADLVDLARKKVVGMGFGAAG
jgi:hypothetical protein